MMAIDSFKGRGEGDPTTRRSIDRERSRTSGTCPGEIADELPRVEARGSKGLAHLSDREFRSNWAARGSTSPETRGGSYGWLSVDIARVLAHRFARHLGM